MEHRRARPDQAALAEDLLRRLRRRFAPGGLLHYGQGKWYPGEPLPRWAFACYWRADGEPIWRDPALIARREARDATPTRERCRGGSSPGLADAARLDPAHAPSPAYEDACITCWREQQLPVNVDPRDSTSSTTRRSARGWRGCSTRAWTSRCGYVLPLQRCDAHGAWPAG